MLPVDIIPLRKEETDLYKIQPSADDKTIRNFLPKPPADRKPGFSFMIEDILGDSQNKRGHEPEVVPPSTCRQCLPRQDSPLLNLVSEARPYSPSQESNRFLSSTSAVFLPPLSPTSVSSRYGYYSPAIASSPPFSFSSRPLDVFTFLPSEYSDHIQANYFNVRQDGLVRSSLCSPSVILDLSNYIPKSSNQRIPPPSVIPLPGANVECPSSRQIIWKHISRNPAKRKGGQIRFTSEQTSSLENTFLEHKYLSSTERKRLATALRLSERQVKTWFQNRRAKWRRVKQDPGGQVSSSDSEDCNPVDETCQVLEGSTCWRSNEAN